METRIIKECMNLAEHAFGLLVDITSPVGVSPFKPQVTQNATSVMACTHADGDLEI